MDKKSSTYRMPEGFNPYSAVNAVRGLTDAIHYTLLEGPGTQAEMSYGDIAGLNALVELLQAEVHALHDYISEIENRATLKLPMSDAEFDALDARLFSGGMVRETPAIYGVS